MLTLEQIKTALSDRKLSSVAENTGLNIHTVRAYAQGKVQRPSFRAIVALSQYLSRDPMEG